MDEQQQQKLETLKREIDRRREEHQTGLSGRRSRRRWFRGFLALTAGIFLALAGVFFFNFLRLNADLIEIQIKQRLIPQLAGPSVPVTIGRVSGDLLSGVDLENLMVRNPHFRSGGVLLAIGRVSLKYSLMDVFFGRAVLERLVISDPVLTLTRDEDGRSIWDFRGQAEEPASVASGPATLPTPGPEQFAERFMQHIEIRNLSMLIPRPRDFFPDPTVAKILRLPPGNISWAGLNLLVRKYPHPDFIDHVLVIRSGSEAPLARLQVSRIRSTGDLTYTLEAGKQRLAVLVQNLPGQGRRLVVLDERNRDRLNLRFVWNRDGVGWENRLSGLNGNLSLNNLEALKDGLPQGLDLRGKLNLTFLASDSDRFRDTNIRANIEEARVVVPGVAEFENGNLDCTLQGRTGRVSRLDFSWMGKTFSQTGEFDFHTDQAMTASFSALIDKEPLAWQVEWQRLDAQTRRIGLQVERRAGNLHLLTTQICKPRQNMYRDTTVSLSIGARKKVADLVPARLVPPAFAQAWASMTAMVDLLGPLKIDGALPGEGGAGDADLTIALDGATIQDPLQKDNRITLRGGVRLASGTMELQNVGFRLDRLELTASGGLELDPATRRFRKGDVEVTGNLAGSEEWEIDGKRLQRLLAGARPVGFDRLFLQGDRVLHLRLGTERPEQTLVLSARKARVYTGRRVLRLEPLACRIRSDEPFNPEQPLPKSFSVEVDGGVFGARCTASAGIDLSHGVFQHLGVAVEGKDLSSLITALSEVPGVREFLTHRQMTLGGAFQVVLSGHGPFLWPSLKGEVRFPRLQVTLPGLSASLPFVCGIETPVSGEYQGFLRTSEAKLNLKGVPFTLNRLQIEGRMGRAKKAREHVLALQISSQVFDTDIQGKLDVLPCLGKVSQARLTIRGRNLDTLSREVARVGQFNIPFSMTGKLDGDWVASGTFRELTSRASFELDGLDLRFPLKSKNAGSSFFDLKQIGGRLELVQNGFNRFDVTIEEGSARCLGAPLLLKGTAHLEKAGEKAWITVLDRLDASLGDLPADGLIRFLTSGVLGSSRVPALTEVSGTVFGSVQISGRQDRYVGLGKVGVKNGGFRFPGLPLPVKNLGGTITLARRQSQGELVLEADSVTAMFGRARLSVPRGSLIDPLGACRIDLTGSLEDVYPTDVLALLSGLQVPSLRFPKEGRYAGKASISGQLGRPMLNVQVKGEETTDLVYTSEGQEYQLPIGKTDLSFRYEPETGSVTFDPAEIGLLEGKILFRQANGQVRGGKALWFKGHGSFAGIQLATFAKGGQVPVRGRLAGSFAVEQKENRSRELLVHLGLQDFKIMSLPVDPDIVERIGLESLEEPEFATGTLNLYLSSDGEADERGRLRIADGLLAGPDLRLEISDSAFDPRNLQVTGKLMINPQPLRRTKIGRKLGKLTKCLQDKATGIPYIDLKVQGTWDNPNLMGKVIVGQLKKRGKRNFIRSIFGGHRPHKASVQELREWFPGWEP